MRIAVCLPARDEAATIGDMVATLAQLRAEGTIQELVVIDGGSVDGTAEIAAAAGAQVHRRDDLMPSFGPGEGKGDSIWRAQSVVDAEILCFFDADLKSFTADYVHAVVEPLRRSPSISLVKGAFERPLRLGEIVLEAGGGRVTELTAKPLLRAFYPELAGLRQPLSGQFAVRAPLLASLPVASGYGVDIGVLIGAWRAVGSAGIAEADLGVLDTSHQSLRELAPMADAVLESLLHELVRDGRVEASEVSRPRQSERPPFAAVRTRAGAGPAASGPPEPAARPAARRAR